jgi:hypothetical protein
MLLSQVWSEVNACVVNEERKCELYIWRHPYVIVTMKSMSYVVEPHKGPVEPFLRTVKIGSSHWFNRPWTG